VINLILSLDDVVISLQRVDVLQHVKVPEGEILECIYKKQIHLQNQLDGSERYACLLHHRAAHFGLGEDKANFH
jgi:hypothetical protein